MTDGHETPQSQRKHIFAVNGDPYFLELIRELLQEEKFNVTTTNFVPRTFDQIEALQPDLIIVDLAIGEQAGWDLLERLQEEAVTREIPTVVTSTDPRFLDIARRNQARYGVGRYIAKPLNLAELREAIEDLIGTA
jgi:CheY-like chemotaxis protein